MPDAVAAEPMVPKPARRRAIGRLTLDIRQNPPLWFDLAALAGALLVAAAVCCGILLGAGIDGADIYETFVVENLSGGQTLISVLAQTAPLFLAGLAATAAFRVRFWNIGIEGQMIFGGLGATAIVVYGLGPPGLRLPLMIAASALGGMAWALLPALLAYRLRINEIITTLLLNYVAAAVMLELLFGPWHDPKDFFPHSQVFGAAERFSKLAGVGTEMLLALGVALLMAWLVHGSRIGLYMKVIHANPRMALAVGLPVAAVSFGAVLLSGAIAGLAGLVLVSQEGRLSDGFVAGYGFSGILIAFLARNHPAAVGVVALLVAMLFDAGRTLQVFDQIPFSIVLLIEAVVVMSVAASEFFLRHRLRWRV
jgi:general nucleoside transport system permease protein